MDFLKLVHQRRAVHHFLSDQQISDEDFKKIMEYVSLTPSGYNAQPWEFILVREKKNLEKLQKIAFDQPHVGQASGVVVVLGDKDIGRNAEQLLQDWVKYGYCTEEEVGAYMNSIAKKRSDEKRKDMALRNSCLAAMTLMYAAEDLGFATCPMMGFSQWQLEEFLDIPEDRVITMLIAIGVADSFKEKKRLPRKSVDEMIHKEKFGKKF